MTQKVKISLLIAAIAMLGGSVIFSDLLISWDEERASVLCARAVEGDRAWPKTDKYKCRAMHMCAEKGELSAVQIETLRSTIADIEYCQKLL